MLTMTFGKIVDCGRLLCEAACLTAFRSNVSPLFSALDCNKFQSFCYIYSAKNLTFYVFYEKSVVSC